MLGRSGAKALLRMLELLAPFPELQVRDTLSSCRPHLPHLVSASKVT